MNHIVGNIDIKTERLLLRQLKESDLEGFFKIFSDPTVVKNYICEGLQSKESVKVFLRKTYEYSKGNSCYFWVIEFDSKMIGFINLCDHVEAFSRCEVGFCIDEDYRGKGYASEALSGVLSFLTNIVGYNKVSAAHFKDNTASGNVMKKANMTYEGERKAEVFYQGKFIDCEYYYYLKDN